MNNANPNWSLKNYYPPLDNNSNSGGVNNITVTETPSPYSNFQLFSLNSLETKEFPIGTFHELSFSVSGTMTLQIDATSQTLTDVDYKLSYPQLNTQLVTITVSSGGIVKGIKTN